MKRLLLALLVMAFVGCLTATALASNSNIVMPSSTLR